MDTKDEASVPPTAFPALFTAANAKTTLTVSTGTTGARKVLYGAVRHDLSNADKITAFDDILAKRITDKVSVFDDRIVFRYGG